MNPRIIVTTTALARPDILRQTYSSWFTKGHLGYKCGFDPRQTKLIINVDPVPGQPNNDAESHECIRVAKHYFGEVEFYEGVGNFAVALKTIWRSAAKHNCDYVLHLEDDWRLKCSIQLDQVLALFEADPHAWQCLFRAYDLKTKHKYGNKFCLTPSLIKKSSVEKLHEQLLDNQNPEECLRKYVRTATNHQNHSGVCNWPEKRIIVEDIGTAWREERKLMRDNPVGGQWTHYLLPQATNVLKT